MMNRKKFVFAIMAALLVCFLAHAASVAAEPAKATIEITGKKTIKAVKSGKAWTAVVDGKQLSATPGGKGGFTLKSGAAIVAAGKTKEDKLKFRTKNGAFYMSLKFKTDKIKIGLKEDDPAPWEIKFYPDKTKVKRSEKELGKINYYPENKKLKAKNAAGATVAECKDLKKKSAALAPFLMDGLDSQKKAFLALILLAMDK